MRLHGKYLYRFLLAGGTAVILSCAPSGAWAQQNSNNQNQAEIQARDTDQASLAAFDRFLDANAELSAQLRANPSLINTADFMSAHPQLQDFLNAHPEVREQLKANPDRFMDRLGRYEASARDRNSDNRPRNANPDLTRRDVATMDQFLDSHQDIERVLASNPADISDATFLREHPDLQQFLNNHPQVREEFAQNPALFMNREKSFEGSTADNDTGRPRNPNPDLTRGEIASMDQFLDSHQDIQKQLAANPSLINNARYLRAHPELQAFLNQHAEVREEFTENPSIFMRRENQLEARGGASGEDVATMDEYLDKHPDVARDLQAYPARVNDSDYLAHHKDLQAFLKKHPQVQAEFTENPSSFMRQESTFEASAEMDDFLSRHKDIGKDLDEDPTRVKDKDYVSHHKDLENFMQKNPGVGDRLETDPSAFMDQQRRFDADRDMDAYLTKHQSVAKDLQKDPARLKDDKYLDHHKDLKEVLEKHPDLNQAAKTDPARFIQVQAKFHEDLKKQQRVHQKTKVEQRAAVHGGLL